MSDDGQSVLAGFIGAFERVNGRRPTADENREALALIEVVRSAQLDPFLVFYLANKRAQDALERVPVDTKSVVDEGIIKVRELIERATAGDLPHGHQRSATRPLATTTAASSPELTLQSKRLCEHPRRTKVTLAHASYRHFITAYAFATTTLALASWAVSGYSVHVVPPLSLSPRSFPA